MLFVANGAGADKKSRGANGGSRRGLRSWRPAEIKIPQDILIMADDGHIVNRGAENRRGTGCAVRGQPEVESAGCCAVRGQPVGLDAKWANQYRPAACQESSNLLQ